MTLAQQPGHRQTRTKFIGSSRRTPCPVCGRAHSDNCRIGSDGLILCFRGSTVAPPTWAQQPGRSHGPGASGEHFAYLGETDAWAMFRPHRPLGQQQRPMGQRRRPMAPKLMLTPEDSLYWSSDPPSYRPTHPIVGALYALYRVRKACEVAA